MIVKEKYAITAKSNSLCPARENVFALIAKGANQFKTVVGSEKKSGLWPLYIETAEEGNIYANIESLVNGKGENVTDDVEFLLDSNYAVVFDKIDGKRLFGEFILYKDEAAANRSSDAQTDDDLSALIGKIADAGVFSKEEIEERVKFMKDNDVDTFLIKRVISGYRKYAKSCHIPSCLYVDPYLEASKKARKEGIISRGLRQAVDRIAVICEGEKSVGKNVYVETIAWLLGMPIYLITFSKQMSPSSIYGEKTTDNSAVNALEEISPETLALADRARSARDLWTQAAIAQGMSAGETKKYVDGLMPKEWKEALLAKAEFDKRAMQAQSVNIIIDQSELYDWLTDGGLICFNEMNMAEANFFASFTNQLLDGTGFLFIPGRGEVPIHKDCVLFGTQNAEYEGVEQQNEATMSRFNCLVFRQPESIRKQIVAATKTALDKSGFGHVSLDPRYYDECERFYKQCRKAVISGVIGNAVLNIRGFVRALSIVGRSDGYAKLRDYLEISVVNTCQADEREPILAILNELVTL